MYGPTDIASASEPATRFRWVVMLTAIILINYIDRSAISYAMGPMAKELGLSEFQKGLILGAFGIGYAVTTLIGGILVDRFGARIVLALSVIFWSAATAITGIASSFFLVLAARAALGLAEGPMFPGQTGAIARWLPERERVRAFGYSLVAVPLSLAIGAPVVSYLTSVSGWREMFFILGAISLAWVPVWWVFFRDDPQSDPVADADRESAKAERQFAQHATSWSELLTSPTLLANYWAFFVFGYFLFFFMTWLPGYLETTFKLDLTSVGWFSVAPWLTAATALVILGNLSDKLQERTGRLRVSRTYLIAGTQALAAMVILPVAFTANLTLALLLITVAVGASMGANAAFYAVNVDVAEDRSATALGIMDFGFALSGFIAPVATGWIVGEQGGFAEAFLLLSALAASSVIVTLLFHRPDKEKFGR